MDTVLLFALVAGCLIGVATGAVIGSVLMHDLEKEYKETLYSLMTNDKLREKTRENIRRINRNSKFDTSLIVDKWEELITKICAKNEMPYQYNSSCI